MAALVEAAVTCELFVLLEAFDADDVRRMVAMFEAFCEGDFETALDLHYELSPLFRSMFIDTNPIPVKKAVELRGMAAGPVRLPLDDGHR